MALHKPCGNRRLERVTEPIFLVGFLADQKEGRAARPEFIPELDATDIKYPCQEILRICRCWRKPSNAPSKYVSQQNDSENSYHPDKEIPNCCGE